MNMETTPYQPKLINYYTVDSKITFGRIMRASSEFIQTQSFLIFVLSDLFYSPKFTGSAY